MLQDARKGLEMEVEVLCGKNPQWTLPNYSVADRYPIGNVLREAQRLGLETPVLKYEFCRIDPS